MKRKIKSICGRYIAIYEKNDYIHCDIKDTETGIVYHDTDDMSIKYQTVAYSAYRVDEYDRLDFKYFTIYFVECGADSKGNISRENDYVNKFNACFKHPKYINYEKSADVKMQEE